MRRVLFLLFLALLGLAAATLRWDSQGPGIVFDVWTKTNVAGPWQLLATNLTANFLTLDKSSPMRFYLVGARWPESPITPP